ncbi:putative peptidoglycan glycosyltransferase FtsW OS=Stutzerimonas stutzeri OX=316 GN=ftsW PE=3 SV=1 [Stutzerimonas stutzeri]
MFAFLRGAPSPLFGPRGLELDFPTPTVLALLGLGLVMITSASSEVAAVNSGNALYHMTLHMATSRSAWAPPA